MLEMLDHTLSVLAVHRPFYILICISTPLPATHTLPTYILYIYMLYYMSV